MRYLDLGTVDAQSSQAVYHALAELWHPDDETTLVTVRPDRPYVCVGYHQIASREIDRQYCADRHIPVGRRMIGGGAVWLDQDQVFWHLVMPHQQISIDTLYRRYLAAPVNAYRQMGIFAEHRPVNDIVVGARKIGGTGASTIGDADVLVGSLMMDFDPQAMVRALNVPSEKFRDKVISSLSDYITTVKRELGKNAPSAAAATRILVEAFAAVLQEEVRPDGLTDQEHERIQWYADRLFDPLFVYRDEGYLVPGLKIREGVRVLEGLYKAAGGLIRIVWRDVNGIIEDVTVGGDFFIAPPDGLERLQAALIGLRVGSDQCEEVVRKVWQTVEAPGVTAGDIIAALAKGEALNSDGGVQKS
ncbi:MAG: lipoate--protein ligase family protein [Sulfobacillus acidophilus]|uniref:Lipoate--protein ligase family protein n=1 Tax=Sulfobacillus acidophilus TaxID=53633 RepID=A0A2T2WG44_9FIRM|nr:MAG: lipoate--protein ligase family protein [Sulfobacillus acidophilus]